MEYTLVDLGNVTRALCLACPLLLITLFIMWKWGRRDIERVGSALPGPPAFPVFGNALEFISEPEELLNKAMSWCKVYPSPFRVWFGPVLAICLYEPVDIQIVLNSSKALRKDPFLYRFFQNSVGTGLFSAPVDKWKKNRRLISPAFNSQLMLQFIPIFNEKNRILLEKLSYQVGKGEFDLIHYIEPMSLDLICRTTMGVDTNLQDNPKNEFAKALRRASELDYMRAYTYWQHPDILFTLFGPKKESEEVNKRLLSFPKSIIQKKKEEFNEMKKMKSTDKDFDIQNKNFLSILLKLSESGASFTDKDLLDEVVTMMIGGSETTSLAVSFCLLMMAIYQDIQTKAFEEVSRILGDQDVTMDKLAQLKYVEMVLNETLRRFTIGPLSVRRNTDEIKITSCTIPKDCTIVVSPLALHMNERIYPEPLNFDPERFSTENVAKRHPFSFLPFSGGPRSCIGGKYAMLSMKTTIALVIRKYHLETTHRMEDIKTRVDVLLRSVNGYPVKISERRRKSD